MRQVGVLAAAGLHALEHHVERLAEDHAKARQLADGLRSIDGLAVDGPHTNMVFVDLPPERVAAFETFMAERGVQVLCYQPRLRLVTHLDLDGAHIPRVIEAFRQFFARH
jgi:threonine aldolase